MSLSIRKMNKGDLEPLYRLLSDSKVMQYLEPPFSPEKTGQFLRSAGLSESPLIYAADKDGEFIGYVIFHRYDDRSDEIGWVLYPEQWGKGYASQLTEQLVSRSFSSGRDLVIECSPDQEVSRHIADKYGFEYEGVSDGLCVYRLKRDGRPNVFLMDNKHPLWNDTIQYAFKSSWRAGPYLANMMRNNSFQDWERVIVAVEDGDIIGYCNFTEKDEMPDDQPYSPFIGFVYVDEEHRGHRVSEKMIEKARRYAKELGYKDIYLMSSEHGLYEKYGFEKIGEFGTVFDTTDQLFRKSTDSE
ncbi:MAG: GNAT family N-acetyltransferase [Oscillospiraceae bacterium]|nr:GNAT family N-acetyltransferase [Oscillospiraceae bacterium]